MKYIGSTADKNQREDHNEIYLDAVKLRMNFRLSQHALAQDRCPGRLALPDRYAFGLPMVDGLALHGRRVNL